MSTVIFRGTAQVPVGQLLIPLLQSFQSSVSYLDMKHLVLPISSQVYGDPGLSHHVIEQGLRAD